MENLVQAIRIGEFINECKLTAYKRLCDGYAKMGSWLRANNLDTPFLELHHAFLKFKGEYDFRGVTSELIDMAKEVSEKAQILADEYRKHENRDNPMLERETTKIIRRKVTVTDWMCTQAKFMMCYMSCIKSCYEEGCKTSK